MSDIQDRELKGIQEDIYQLGVDWFTWKNDITREELGKPIGTSYRHHLSYQEYFEVTMYENGASAFYSPTGSTKLFRNKQLPFQIAKQLKSRDRELNRLMGP